MRVRNLRSPIWDTFCASKLSARDSIAARLPDWPPGRLPRVCDRFQQQPPGFVRPGQQRSGDNTVRGLLPGVGSCVQLLQSPLANRNRFGVSDAAGLLLGHYWPLR
jgi:hypothetical protein